MVGQPPPFLLYHGAHIVGEWRQAAVVMTDLIKVIVAPGVPP